MRKLLLALPCIAMVACNKQIEPFKLSMWVKLLYWAIDTNKKELL